MRMRTDLDFMHMIVYEIIPSLFGLNGPCSRLAWRRNQPRKLGMSHSFWENIGSYGY